MRSPNLPEMKDLIKGRIYKIRCRNLSYGIWDGKEGFMGIRTKFGNEFLFTELHWDASESFGTVMDAKDINIDFDGDIDCRNVELFNFLKNIENGKV